MRVARVEAGVIVTREGNEWATYALACRVTPPNFALLREDEKSAALDSMYSLLASADQPLQIVCRTQPYDLEAYFRGFRSAVKRQRQPRLRRLTVAYLDWLERFGRRNRILEREFYVVVSQRAPYSQNGPLPPALDETRQRGLRALRSAIANVRQQLMAAGSEVHVLTSADSVRLLQSTLQPRTFSRQSQLRRAFQRADGSNSPDARLRVPDIHIEADHIRLGQDFVRTLMVRQYPERVPVAWLHDVLTLDQRIVTSLHYAPTPAWRVLKRLKRIKIALRQNIASKEKKGFDATEDRPSWTHSMRRYAPWRRARPPTSRSRSG